MARIIDEDDVEDVEDVEIHAVDPLFFPCEECQGPCRGHAFAEPLATLVAAMEIGLGDRPDPTEEHDEVPLPLQASSVEAFVAEFDDCAGHWGTWDPAKPEWKLWVEGWQWSERLRRRREQKKIAVALLRVLLLNPRAWKDHGGWRGSLDNEWVRDKVAKCGISIADWNITNYVVELRAAGQLSQPTRNQRRRRVRCKP